MTSSSRSEKDVSSKADEKSSGAQILSALKTPAIKIKRCNWVTLPPDIDLRRINKRGDFDISKRQLRADYAGLVDIVVDRIKMARAAGSSIEDAQKAYGINADSEGFDIIFQFPQHVCYVDKKVIAKGSFGQVHYANSQGGQWYVVKKMFAIDNVQEKVKAEFAIAQEMNLGVFHTHDAYVMRWIPGVNLHDFLNSDPILPTAQWCRIAASLGNQLANFSKANIAHRDISLRNIILQNTFDQCVIIDMGAACKYSAGGQIAKHQKSTPNFCAPELLDKTSGDIDAKAADTFSMAIVEANLFGLDNLQYYAAKDKAQFAEKEGRIVSENSPEFKENARIDNLKMRTQILEYLRRKSAYRPAERATSEEGSKLYQSLALEAQKVPIIKAIFDINEVYRLYTKMNDQENSSASACEFAAEDLYYFISALKKADVVVLAESRRHTLVERTKVEHALMYEMSVNGLILSGINREPKLYFSDDKSATLEQIIAGIPAFEKAKNPDANCIYFVVTRKQIKLPQDLNVSVFHPEELLVQVNEAGGRNAFLLAKKGKFACADVKKEEVCVGKEVMRFKHE